MASNNIRVINMESERLGILLILFGMSLFCIQDIFIKLIINDTSILQILVFRAFLGFIFLTGYLYINKKKITYIKLPHYCYNTWYIIFCRLYFFLFPLQKYLWLKQTLYFYKSIIVTFLSVFYSKTQLEFIEY